jgi:hypothetical protein
MSTIFNTLKLLGKFITILELRPDLIQEASQTGKHLNY